MMCFLVTRAKTVASQWDLACHIEGKTRGRSIPGVSLLSLLSQKADTSTGL